MAESLGVDGDIDALSKSMTPVPPETSENIALEIAYLEEKQGKVTTDKEFIAINEKLEERKKDLAETQAEEADTEGFLNSEFGQSIVKWGKVGLSVSKRAVKIYADRTGDPNAKAIDAAGNILSSPTTDPEDAALVYKAVDKLNGNKLSKKIGNSRAEDAMLNSILETSVAIGTPTATEQILTISPNKQTAIASILSASGKPVKSGDLTAIAGVTNVVTSAQFNAANEDAPSAIGASYVPDRTQSDDENSNALVGVMNSIGTNWEDTSMYSNMNPSAKKALGNPNVVNSGARLLEMTISDSYA